jgi:hypothetical protein
MFVALLLACQDYNVVAKGGAPGQYNPPDLSVETREDRITQVPVSSVDVLWVIDNSCSMIEEQQSLEQNFDSFMQYFTASGLDYHVGVVTTDMSSNRESGRLVTDTQNSQRYIDNTFSESDAIATFGRRAVLGTDGDSDERGKDAVRAALVDHVNGVNAGFYREDAALSVVVISDEPDFSTISVNTFTQWMRGLKVSEEMVSFSSIVGPLPNGCTPPGGDEWSSAEAGEGYVEVTRDLGGVEWSICSPDWQGALTELGLQAAGLKREFYLSLVPVESSISVHVEPQDGEPTAPFVAGTDYTYSRARNSITFLTFVPPPLAQVVVRYEVLASTPIEAGTSTGTAE